MKGKIKKSNRKRSVISKVYTVIGVLAIMFSVTFIASLTFNSFSKPIESSASNYIQVSVAPGDTLWNIAKEYHTEGDIRNYIIEIEQLNNLKTSNLFVDQQLYIPIKEA